VDDILQSAHRIQISSVRGILARTELSDLCATARACAVSALYRTESRAAHYRDDFQASSPEWRRNIFYTEGNVSTKAIEPDPGEASWDAARKAAASGQAGAEKEYVE
jgi:succinate dehydrogenase/fumarate reductase flavoprotein subunit